MRYPVDDFCYMELDFEHGCVFVIPFGFTKPQTRYVKNCDAYHESIKRNDRIGKFVLLRCPDCSEEGRYCNNETASYDDGVGQ